MYGGGMLTGPIFQASDFRLELLQPLERNRVRRFELLRPQRHPQFLEHPAHFFQLGATHPAGAIGNKLGLVGLPVASGLLRV